MINRPGFFNLPFMLKFASMLKQLINQAGKKAVFIVSLLLLNVYSFAQCSICTRTAQQLGEGPAKDLNAGILYLAFAPVAIAGYIGYRWFKSHKS